MFSGNKTEIGGKVFGRAKTLEIAYLNQQRYPAFSFVPEKGPKSIERLPCKAGACRIAVSPEK